MDQFADVTHVSWFTRIRESIKSVLIGLVLFLGAFPLLWWNEGRAVQTAQSLDEGAGAVKSVSADRVDGQNEGKLVHLSALARTDDVLKDADFGIAEPAIKLVRSVEMYQWVESEKTEKDKKVGGGEKRTTTYRYDEQWSSEVHDSSDFEHPEGHQNPAVQYEERTSLAQNVSVGAFDLPPELVAAIPGKTPLPISEASLGKLTPALRDKTRVSDGAFHVRPSATSADFDTSQPQVGDHRIRFWMVPAAPVTVVARQQGSSLGPYQTKAGDPILIIKAGTLSAEQVFDTAQAENRTLTWILRLVGFLCMLIGISMIFRPLVVLADVIPLLGSLLSLGTFLVGLALALPLSTLTIGVAWVAVRPLVGVPLLVLALGLLVLAILLGRKRLAKRRASAPA